MVVVILINDLQLVSGPINTSRIVCVTFENKYKPRTLNLVFSNETNCGITSNTNYDGRICSNNSKTEVRLLLFQVAHSYNEATLNSILWPYTP